MIIIATIIKITFKVQELDRAINPLDQKLMIKARLHILYEREAQDIIKMKFKNQFPMQFHQNTKKILTSTGQSKPLLTTMVPQTITTKVYLVLKVAMLKTTFNKMTTLWT